MSIQELESFFQTTEYPKSLKLNKSATLNNTDTFIDTCLTRIKEWNGDLEKCPDYWHIMELVEFLNKKD